MFRVLELSSPATAPCGRLLVEAGLTVTRVVAPGAPAGGAWSEFHDRGKAAVAFDPLREPDRLRALLADADVLVEGYPPGRLATAGLDPALLIAVRPGLVVVSITPFGQTGPYRDHRADDLVVFAMGGVMFISGEPGRAPVTAPDRQAWVTAGAHGAFAAMCALWAREETGGGDWVDVSAFECLAAQENTLTNVEAPGAFTRRRGSQHRTALPGRIYACRDGFVHLFISREADAWQRFLTWIGEPPELADPELAEVNARWRSFDLVDRVTARWVAGRTREELFESGQAAHLPVAPVNTPADFLADPQTRYQGAVVTGPDGRRHLRPAIGLDGAR